MFSSEMNKYIIADILTLFPWNSPENRKAETESGRVPDMTVVRMWRHESLICTTRVKEDFSKSSLVCVATQRHGGDVYQARHPHSSSTPHQSDISTPAPIHCTIMAVQKLDSSQHYTHNITRSLHQQEVVFTRAKGNIWPPLLISPFPL